eukprot:238882_1
MINCFAIHVVTVLSRIDMIRAPVRDKFPPNPLHKIRGNQSTHRLIGWAATCVSSCVCVERNADGLGVVRDGSNITNDADNEGNTADVNWIDTSIVSHSNSI